jgi:hypothetical protein
MVDHAIRSDENKGAFAGESCENARAAGKTSAKIRIKIDRFIMRSSGDH